MLRHKRLVFVALLVALSFVCFACSSNPGNNQPAAATPDASPTSFQLSSTAFTSMGTIPKQNTCDNPSPDTGLSPPLAWTNPPAGVVAFALTVRDPDSPTGDTKHWGLINLPADMTSLAEGVSPLGTLPPGAWQTLNYSGRVGYAGPCPPHGAQAHRYNFTLIALKKKIDNPGGNVELDKVLPQIEQAALASVTLTGLYGR
jgi:hypothetical protein